MRGMGAPKLLPEGEYLLTWKTEAEVVSGSALDLFTEMLKFQRAVQYAINVMWGWKKLSKNRAHKEFYKQFREQYGFRAHEAKQAYVTAMAIVQSSKSNGGRRPKLKRAFLRLDKYDAELDWDKLTLKLKLSGKKQVVLRLKPTRHLQQFRGRKWYEVHITFRRGRIYVSIPCKFEYKLYKPKGWIGTDLNFSNVVLWYQGKTRWFSTRNDEALREQRLAEKVQQRHPHTWRLIRKYKEEISNHHRKKRNILSDDMNKLARRIVLLAKKLGLGIAIEDLEGLRYRLKDAELNDKAKRKLMNMAYNKFRTAVISQAVKHNVPLALVDPRGTSSYCPVCEARLLKLEEYNERIAICPKCRRVYRRDEVGAWNVALRAGEPEGIPGPGLRRDEGAVTGAEAMTESSTEARVSAPDETRVRGMKRDKIL